MESVRSSASASAVRKPTPHVPWYVVIIALLGLAIPTIGVAYWLLSGVDGSWRAAATGGVVGLFLLLAAFVFLIASAAKQAGQVFDEDKESFWDGY